MGDRTSIQFMVNDSITETSVVLFAHWGGISIVQEAVAYIQELKMDDLGGQSPLGRYEPCYVMIDFIRHQLLNGNLDTDDHYSKSDTPRVMSNHYLGKDEEDGDNSDNGHFVIDITKERVYGRSPTSDIPFSLVQELG